MCASCTAAPVVHQSSQSTPASEVVKHLQSAVGGHRSFTHGARSAPASDVNKATTPKSQGQNQQCHRMSPNATAVIWLKHGTVYLDKHLEISSNSYIQRITHAMLVPCCHTSLLHFKYTSNESDMRAHAANAKD